MLSSSVERTDLIRALQTYETRFTEEHTFIPSFLDLLTHTDCYQRTHLPGHITGSAWIVNQSQTKSLLVHHGKLNRWIQPGGHADGDENIFSVALKEAEEETGLTSFKKTESIFDIDIHIIPARKDFPEHLHFDVRFMFTANEKDEITVSDESHDVKWIAFDEMEKYTSERSVLRMKEKILCG